MAYIEPKKTWFQACIIQEGKNRWEALDPIQNPWRHFIAVEWFILIEANLLFICFCLFDCYLHWLCIWPYSTGSSISTILSICSISIWIIMQPNKGKNNISWQLLSRKKLSSTHGIIRFTDRNNEFRIITPET